ncbi:radiation sensitive protein rad9 [Savitreella phatthalungensis]
MNDSYDGMQADTFSLDDEDRKRILGLTHDTQHLPASSSAPLDDLGGAQPSSAIAATGSQNAFHTTSQPHIDEARLMPPPATLPSSSQSQSHVNHHTATMNPEVGLRMRVADAVFDQTSTQQLEATQEDPDSLRRDVDNAPFQVRTQVDIDNIFDDVDTQVDARQYDAADMLQISSPQDVTPITPARPQPVESRDASPSPVTLICTGKASPEGISPSASPSERAQARPVSSQPAARALELQQPVGTTQTTRPTQVYIPLQQLQAAAGHFNSSGGSLSDDDPDFPAIRKGRDDPGDRIQRRPQLGYRQATLPILPSRAPSRRRTQALNNQNFQRYSHDNNDDNDNDKALDNEEIEEDDDFTTYNDMMAIPASAPQPNTSSQDRPSMHIDPTRVETDLDSGSAQENRGGGSGPFDWHASLASGPFTQPADTPDHDQVTSPTSPDQDAGLEADDEATQQDKIQPATTQVQATPGPARTARRLESEPSTSDAADSFPRKISRDAQQSTRDRAQAVLIDSPAVKLLSRGQKRHRPSVVPDTPVSAAPFSASTPQPPNKDAEVIEIVSTVRPAKRIRHDGSPLPLDGNPQADKAPLGSASPQTGGTGVQAKSLMPSSPPQPSDSEEEAHDHETTAVAANKIPPTFGNPSSPIQPDETMESSYLSSIDSMDEPSPLVANLAMPEKTYNKRVFALDKSSNAWYPATIEAYQRLTPDQVDPIATLHTTNDNIAVSVRFDDATSKSLPVSCLRPLELVLGDVVRVIAPGDKGKSIRITALHQRPEDTIDGDPPATDLAGHTSFAGVRLDKSGLKGHWLVWQLQLTQALAKSWSKRLPPIDLAYLAELDLPQRHLTTRRPSVSAAHAMPMTPSRRRLAARSTAANSPAKSVRSIDFDRASTPVPILNFETNLPQPPELVSDVFAGIAFVLTFVSEAAASQRSIIVRMIQANAGTVLVDGFDELFEPLRPALIRPPSETKASLDLDPQAALKLQPAFAHLNAAVCISDRPARKAKYLQALSLGMPCVHPSWLSACIASGGRVDFRPFLLAAGEARLPSASNFSGPTDDIAPSLAEPQVPITIDTELVQLSMTAPLRLASNFDSPDGLDAALRSRALVYSGHNVLIIAGATPKEQSKRAIHVFLAYALGAERVGIAASWKDAVDVLLPSPNDTWTIVNVLKADDAVPPITITRKRGKTRPRNTKKQSNPPDQQQPQVQIVTNEDVVQTCITGRLYTTSPGFPG